MLHYLLDEDRTRLLDNHRQAEEPIDVLVSHCSFYQFVLESHGFQGFLGQRVAHDLRQLNFALGERFALQISEFVFLYHSCEHFLNFLGSF